MESVEWGWRIVNEEVDSRDEQMSSEKNDL